MSDLSGSRKMRRPEGGGETNVACASLDCKRRVWFQPRIVEGEVVCMHGGEPESRNLWEGNRGVYAHTSHEDAAGRRRNFLTGSRTR